MLRILVGLAAAAVHPVSAFQQLGSIGRPQRCSHGVLTGGLDRVPLRWALAGMFSLIDAAEAVLVRG